MHILLGGQDFDAGVAYQGLQQLLEYVIVTVYSKASGFLNKFFETTKKAVDAFQWASKELPIDDVILAENDDVISELFASENSRFPTGLNH